MEIWLFIGGFAAGLLVGLVLLYVNVRNQQRMRDAFSSLSLDALHRNAEQFLHLADEKLKAQTAAGSTELEGKKTQITETVQGLKVELDKVTAMVTTLEKDRHQKFGALTEQLARAASQTENLQNTTRQLQEALANTKARGQWGERMAEDVLRMAGFIEGVNYRKQKTLEGSATRPDYTFMLPKGQFVHMDVKFPLDNYLRYLGAASDTERTQFTAAFLKDARDRIKEATKRGYVGDTPTGDTLDYVLVFIPNEQVYAFLNEHDTALLDEALRQKVILCSPMTLYAILAVIRQAVENFRLENTAGQMLGLLADFRKQWVLFTDALEKVEKKFVETQNSFTTLLTTRRNMLERPLNKMDALEQVEHETGQLADHGKMAANE